LGGYLLNILVILLVLWLIYFFLDLLKRKEDISALFVFLIILGALSNLLDRLKFGYVVDYLDLRYFTVFNLADCLIVGGAVGIIWLQIIKKEPIY
jgi:signal peptidase II